MIIDVHAHCSLKPIWLGYDFIKDKFNRFITLEELLDRMGKESIDMAAILPLQSPESTIETVSTREVLEMYKRYPSKIIPFCNPDPRLYLGNKRALEFILEEYKKMGCKGVGEVTANIYFDDPRALNLFDICERLQLPILFHIGPKLNGYYGLVDDLGLPRLEKVLKMFPNLIFIGHSQPFWAEISGDLKPEERNRYPKGKVKPGGRVVELLRNYPNLYADLSAGSGYNAISRDKEFGIWFLEEFKDKLLFGTDIDVPNQEVPQLAYLKKLLNEGEISRNTYDKIMYRNAINILKINI